MINLNKGIKRIFWKLLHYVCQVSDGKNLSEIKKLFKKNVNIFIFIYHNPAYGRGRTLGPSLKIPTTGKL